MKSVSYNVKRLFVEFYIRNADKFTEMITLFLVLHRNVAPTWQFFSNAATFSPYLNVFPSFCLGKQVFYFGDHTMYMLKNFYRWK